MKTLGTILPDPEQLPRADAFADRKAAERIKFGNGQLAGCEQRFVGGETRWYLTPTKYAIVGGRGYNKVLWFKVTPTGDYRCK